jgi:serine/threonine-protein kinase
MGVVYRARDPRLDRTVALKILAPELASDPDFRRRFEREARLAALIEHPNVVPVYQAGEHDGHLYLAMRLIEGTDLRATIAAERRLAPARAARIVAQVGEALDAAHARALLHRDVKPANILLEPEGAGERAYLGDFGLSRRAGDERLTHTGQWPGTIDYLAPELLQGGPSDRGVDVYALGCVLFEALTGRLPFQGESPVAKLWGHLSQAPPRPHELRDELPAALDDVVARAMAKKPRERFASAGELGAAALLAVGEGEARR